MKSNIHPVPSLKAYECGFLSISNYFACELVHNEQLGVCHGSGSMRLSLIRYLVNHTRPEREDTPILKLGLQFPLDAQQQVILGLSRYGGLRTPSETLSLRWGDIDRELNRMSIPEPKVEHHEGRGIRSCPIFPDLRPILDEAFEIFGDKSEYAVAAPQYRAAANTAMGWKNANLLTELRIEN
jgi:integrase